MRVEAFCFVLGATSVARLHAQKAGNGIIPPSDYSKPLEWFPEQGDILDYDFERWGDNHDYEYYKFQLSMDPMMEALGCVLERIRPTYGGGPTKTIALLIPKTGTRHLQAIMDTEYGQLQRMTRCHPAPSFHYRPPEFSDEYSADWTPDDSCRDEAMRLMERNTVVWSHLKAEMTKRNLKFITVVRRPVPYFLSFFSYRRNFDPKAAGTIPELSRFIAREQLSSNMQLGFLVRKRNCGARCHMAHTPGVTEEDLSSVLQMIDRGELLAGTCERLESTVRMFAAELGWKKFDPDTYGSFEPRVSSEETEFRNIDVTTSKLRESDLTREMLAEIQRVSLLDQKLYDFVSERLSEYAPFKSEL